MADYAASVLVKGQAIVTAKYQEPEQRRQNPSIMALALKNQDISIPNAAELRVSPLRTADVNYLSNVAPGSATAKAVAHTGTRGDSAIINVVYIQHVETFGLEMKIADNNFFPYQQIFNNRLEIAWKNLRTRHDNSALSFVVANRCELSNAVMTPLIASANPGTWNETNYALEIDSANKPLAYELAKSLMKARFYNGPDYDVIADLQLARLFQFQSQQGAGNFQDLAYQFENSGITVTQQQVSSAYTKGAFLIMPKGTLAGLNWNEAMNKRGLDAGINSVGRFFTADDPLGSGARADVSCYTARANSSSNTYGGSVQDVVDQWEITVTIGYVLPPLTTASDSVVHMIGLMD
jgi:hypothetical protein